MFFQHDVAHNLVQSNVLAAIGDCFEGGDFQMRPCCRIFEDVLNDSCCVWIGEVTKCTAIVIV